MIWVIRGSFILFVLCITALIYAAINEGDLKAGFDTKCKDAGGIPLRSTYLYDAKDNVIHYVCLKTTSIMKID